MKNHATNWSDPRPYRRLGPLLLLALVGVACGSEGSATPSAVATSPPTTSTILEKSDDDDFQPAATTTPPTTSTIPEEPDVADELEPGPGQPASTRAPNETPTQEPINGLVLSFKDPPVGEGGDAAEISGTLEIDQEGCLLLRRSQGVPVPPFPVLWPFGATWNAEPPGVLLSSGRIIELGDKVSAAGGYSRADAVLRLVGDDDADTVERCNVPGSEFAIINNSDNQIE